MGGSENEFSGASTYQTLLTDSRLLVIILIAFVGPMSVNVPAPVLADMATSMEISDAQIGLIMTAITLPAIFLTPFIGVIGDIYGRRTIALPALFLFGIAGIAIYFVDDFQMVLALRVLQGIGMAVIPAVSVTLLGDLYSGPTGSTAQGLRTGMNGISASAVPIAVGILAALGWRFPFLLYGFAFVVMILTYIYCPETAKGRDTAKGITPMLRQYSRSIRNEISNFDLIVLLFGGGVRFFTLFSLITFIPLFAVRVLDATPFIVGILLSLRAVRIIIGPSVGFLTAYTSRIPILIGAQSVILGSVILTPFVPDLIWLGILILVFSIGDAVFGPILNDTVTTRVSDKNRNGIVSVMRSLVEIGKTTAPAGLGIVLVFGGFSAVFLVTALISLIYIIILTIILIRNKN